MRVSEINSPLLIITCAPYLDGFLCNIYRMRVICTYIFERKPTYLPAYVRTYIRVSQHQPSSTIHHRFRYTVDFGSSKPPVETTKP